MGGGANLLAYIGHNGLMDFRLDSVPSRRDARTRDAVVLCCKSEAYFSKPLLDAGARPLMMTTQLMYPGAFILREFIESWAVGESPDRSLDRAARAYARNQQISGGAARRIFTVGNLTSSHRRAPSTF